MPNPAEGEPTEPSKPGSVGFVGCFRTASPITDSPRPETGPKEIDAPKGLRGHRQT